MSLFRALTSISKRSSKSFQSLFSQSSPPIGRLPTLTSNQLILGHRFIGLHRDDGRLKGALWRTNKLIGKEALFVILGLKRFQNDEEKLNQFFKIHVARLLKPDMVNVLIELERQGEVFLADKMFEVIKKEQWYKPDVYLYKDFIIALAKKQKMEEAMKVWEEMRKEGMSPDTLTYAAVICGFVKNGSPEDAMNVYEDMKKCLKPPEEKIFRVIIKGLMPFPLLRARVMQEYEEIFPDNTVTNPRKRFSGGR